MGAITERISSPALTADPGLSRLRTSPTTPMGNPTITFSIEANGKTCWTEEPQINSVSVRRQRSLFNIFRAYQRPNRKPGMKVQIVGGSGGLVDGEFKYK